VPLPLDVNIMGLSYLRTGEDLQPPVKEEDYPFSFEVYGHYALPQEGDGEAMTEGPRLYPPN
jgi:hypothetical protein